MDLELKKLFEHCKTSLSKAPTYPNCEWKLFTFSNVSNNGLPRSRYVVLRDTCFKNKSEIVFFTDNRSQKVDELKLSPEASLCFFDRASGLQLSVSCKVTLHNKDEIAENYWKKTSWTSLQCYYMKEKPGETLTAPFMLNTNDLSKEEAYAYFTVVKCSMTGWDILQLKQEGNQRALCDFNDFGEFENCRWAAP